ncbi:hypothetical protein Tco_0605413, partial [Tanacetum coccineum]
NGWVHAPGLMGCNLENVHRGVTRLDRQMFDRGRIPAELQFQEEPPIHHAFAPRVDETYAMIWDAAIAAREDDDDDITASRDSQPSEPRGSPRDP